MPLGSAALAGTSLPIDRSKTQASLGFDAIATNSLDAASDRDFVCELAFVLCSPQYISRNGLRSGLSTALMSSGF